MSNGRSFMPRPFFIFSRRQFISMEEFIPSELATWLSFMMEGNPKKKI